MAVITFVESNGTRHSLAIKPGASVMEVARQNGVPGIVAECGGSAACGTCRVQVDEAWESRIPPPGPLEMSLLDGLEGNLSRERLSCQIVCGEKLDGLIVHISASQY